MPPATRRRAALRPALTTLEDRSLATSLIVSPPPGGGTPTPPPASITPAEKALGDNIYALIKGNAQAIQALRTTEAALATALAGNLRPFARAIDQAAFNVIAEVLYDNDSAGVV